ncbi:hypothetical protein BP6252_07091 [Coleophoma cylindrospora]|uniref:Uncharacterized protein n=1 Tax=Coleophoma cylindrospora TaxID=1849047 RepID=A0A3D8RH20_9HELO|nr:hypothetical protein BP6252_07091 [Coleophoma cylindrospora]
MYKWHVHSAAGRGRPFAADIVRVTDGIAASLKHFSISASRSAEEQEKKPAFTISRTFASEGQPTRSQKTARAVGELSSIAQAKPRGIDARSLAAKPTGATVIRRVDESRLGGLRGGFTSRGVGRGGRGGFSPRTPRDGSIGAPASGRTGGRGGKGRRGRRGSADNKDDDGRKKKKSEELSTELDSAWQGTMGKRIYVPSTSLESLMADLPAVAMSQAPISAARALTNSLQVMTGDTKQHTVTPEDRVHMINNGQGTMMWDAEEKAELAKYAQRMIKKHPNHAARYTFPELKQEQKDALVDMLIAGRQEDPKPPQRADPLGTAASYARRNETYLSGDSDKLTEKLRSLLPSQAVKPQTKPQPKSKPVVKKAVA